MLETTLLVTIVKRNTVFKIQKILCDDPKINAFFEK